MFLGWVGGVMLGVGVCFAWELLRMFVFLAFVLCCLCILFLCFELLFGGFMCSCLLGFCLPCFACVGQVWGGLLDLLPRLGC